jgi:WD40 repeat protein
VWDRQNGIQLLELNGHYGFVNSVAISYDTKIIVSGGEDKTIKVWEL